MPPRPFRIGRSRTGLGLFATRPIKKRARIAEYKGPLLDVKAAEKEENKGNRYLFEVNTRWTIDGKLRGNIARYFNHSCNPNADTTIRGKRVFIYTLRAIKPGEEITYNYGIDYLKNVIGKSNCKCARCRRRRAKRARELRAAQKLNGKAGPARTRTATRRKRAKA
jgi:SET domain-containing protein